MSTRSQDHAPPITAVTSGYPAWVEELAQEQANGLRLLEALKGAREYVTDALDAHEHSDGRELLNRIDAAIAKAVQS